MQYKIKQEGICTHVFQEGLLVEAKNGDTQFYKQNLHPTNEIAENAFKILPFSPIQVGRRGGTKSSHRNFYFKSFQSFNNVVFFPFVMGQSKWHITKGPIIVAFPHYCALFPILGHKNPRLHISVSNLCTPPLQGFFWGENFHQNVKNKVKREYSINIFPLSE